MVPKVAGKGRSFVGAGLYYLHDKKASTRNRVAFTHTENLPTRDPDKAIKCMAYTAIRQDEIKIRAGGSAKGRKLTQPVYCYSLSWAPGEDPSQEDMIAAAKETVRILGLSGHEALFVGHNDEPHPHIHVIVNRVHPETGVAAKLSMDHLKLSAWAEEFERNQGKIRCEQRVENNQRRRKGDFVRDFNSQNAAEFHRWRQERTARQLDKRAMETAVLDARHERERDHLKLDRDRKLEDLRKRQKELTRADWRDLYSIQRQEEGRLNKAQGNAWTRLRFFARTHRKNFRAADPTSRKQMLKGAFSALIGSQKQFAELERAQREQRIQYARALKAKTQGIRWKINEEYEKRLAQLTERQNHERQAQQQKHSAKSQDEAREIKQGRDRDIYRKEKQQKRESKLKDNKKDIVSTNRKPRNPSLRDKFAGARGKVSEKTLDKGDRSATSPIEGRDRGPEFRELAREITAKGLTPSRSGGLSEQFRRARDGAETPPPENKRSKFKENAKEVSQDVARERNRPRISPRGPRPGR